MYIKQFRSVQVRVPDPMRPGKRTFEERLIPTHAGSLSDNGKTITADVDGWFEVDHELSQRLLKIRHPGGERFYTPDQVDEQVRLGLAQSDEGDKLPKAKKPVRA